MLRSISKQSVESAESVLKKKRTAIAVGRIAGKEVLSVEWKSEGVMDDESGESMEKVPDVPTMVPSPNGGS